MTPNEYQTLRQAGLFLLKSCTKFGVSTAANRPLVISEITPRYRIKKTARDSVTIPGNILIMSETYSFSQGDLRRPKAIKGFSIY
jgi:hypothetical protein